jgi:hypothetical protein
MLGTLSQFLSIKAGSFGPAFLALPFFVFPVLLSADTCFFAILKPVVSPKPV